MPPTYLCKSSRNALSRKYGRRSFAEKTTWVYTTESDCGVRTPDTRSSLHLQSQTTNNPNGIVSQSPGLRGTSYPGKTRRQTFQPQRGCVPLFARLPKKLACAASTASKT